jgi:hypothetical protein
MADYGHTSPEAPCGTQACIGGWAVILGKKIKNVPRFLENHWRYESYFWYAAGKKLLGLTEQEANILFTVHTDRKGLAGAVFMSAEIDKLIKDRDKFVKSYMAKQ